MNGVHKVQDYKKSNNARKRWDVLARAIEKQMDVRKPSQCFSMFSQINQYVLSHGSESLFECNIHIGDRHFSVKITRPSQYLSPENLIGFNNTGNVYIWPSEEALTFYVLSNPEMFSGRRILELGGGFSCLAGLMIACHLNPENVHLTDGNMTSVENVTKCLKYNKFMSKVNCSLFKWDSNTSLSVFDIIICADCLFFDESRNNLIETIWNNLSSDGVALVMAPKRGLTFVHFMNLAEERGFYCRKMLYYNKYVWIHHMQLLNNPDYNVNIHYPLLLCLSKNKIK